MIIVLFEVTVKKEYQTSYLELAASLREEYIHREGFIRAERFSSLSEEGKILSMSVWASEEAIESWRNALHHRWAQKRGREVFFESYRITVVSPLRSYTQDERSQAPEDSKAYWEEEKT